MSVSVALKYQSCARVRERAKDEGFEDACREGESSRGRERRDTESKETSDRESHGVVRKLHRE